MPGLTDALNLPCRGDHEHIATEGGKYTLLSGKYPQGLSDMFHIHEKCSMANKNPKRRIGVGGRGVGSERGGHCKVWIGVAGEERVSS